MKTKNGGYFIAYPSRSYTTAQGESKFWNLFRWKDKETAEKAKEWILGELANLEPSLFQTETREESHIDDSEDDLPF